jgi:O-antigen/teichoic acid export membrane protein
VSAEFPDEPPGPIPFDLAATRRPDAGLKVIRGATVRGLGYGLGMALTAVSSIFLLRYLGAGDFGRYTTVTSLVAIAAGLTDAGLTAVGTRELAVRSDDSRRRLLSNLLGLRLVITPLGVAVALVFAVVAGYDRTLVLGTLLAGLALILFAIQGTMSIPLMVDLKNGRITTLELAKQAAMLVGIVLLVAIGAELLPFFAISIGVGGVALLLMPMVAGRDLVWRPTFERSECWTLVREALPLAAAVVVGVVYFRLLIVLMSLLSTDVETGLFATSFRVIEILYGIATLAATVALPMLSVAVEDRTRLRYMLQRMVEVSMIGSCYLVFLVVVIADPLLRILGGEQYVAAAPVLKIQAFALIPVFLGQAIVVGLISVRRTSVQVIANALALPLLVVLGLVLIPPYGAKGAAVAAVIAEFGYALALLLLFLWRDPTLRPRFWFLWKIGLAAVVASATVLATSATLPAIAAAVIGTAAYAAVLWFTDAIPPEVRDAAVLRRRA